jgi:glycine reductase complex component B subunit gamma
MAVEMERRGLPVAMISALPPVALELGANRVVRGVKIPHPVGEPNADPERDTAVRMEIVERALKALATPIERPTIF